MTEYERVFAVEIERSSQLAKLGYESLHKVTGLTRMDLNMSQFKHSKLNYSRGKALENFTSSLVKLERAEEAKER